MKVFIIIILSLLVLAAIVDTLLIIALSIINHMEEDYPDER